MGEGWNGGWGSSGKLAQFKGKRSRETPKLCLTRSWFPFETVLSLEGGKNLFEGPSAESEKKNLDLHLQGFFCCL